MPNMNFGSVLFLIGLLLAVVAGFLTIPMVGGVVFLIGLVVGFMNITKPERPTALLAIIAFAIIGVATLTGAIGGMFTALGIVSAELTAIITNIGAYFLAIAIAGAVSAMYAVSRNK